MPFILDVVTNKWIVPKDTQPSFAGRNVIVTGANIGLGYETALKFVQQGAKKVILAVRTISKGEEAGEKIEAQSKRKNVVEVWQLDMLSYDSIKAFTNRVSREIDHLDIVCLNAGIIAMPFQTVDNGFEKTMQVNVLSTALLALLLLPKLRASKTEAYTPVLEIVGSSNVYTVSKLADYNTPFAAYNKQENYSIERQYSVSKVFVNFVQEALVPLAANKDTGKPDVFIPVVCPGACRSELGRDAKAWYLRMAMFLFATLIQRTTEEGARTYISGVEFAEKTHGRLWKNDRIQPPAPLQQGKNAKVLQQKVWKEITEALMKDNPEVKQLAAL